jgi:DNA helicase HerA-like ATPase
MNTFVEKLFAGFWNRFASRHCHRPSRHGLRLGFRVRDDDPTRDEVEITQTKRPEHLAILGKTGRGKSSLIRYLSRQDVDAGRGFTYFDLHGDATPFLLGSIAAAERRAGCDLSDKLIVIEPADPTYSVGLNPLEGAGGGRSFVQIS